MSMAQHGSSFSVRNLRVAVSDREILSGLTLTIRPSELHVLMGPNGSGKTTLAQAIAGNPAVSVTSGSVRLGRYDLTRKAAEERSRLGLFVAFQQPLAIPGVPIVDFLRLAALERNATRLRPSEAREFLAATFTTVGLPEEAMARELNVGFSGGEQKRFELAQLLFLGAKAAVLDEIDSGLDVDGIQAIAAAIGLQQSRGTAILLITHNPHILDYLRPKAIHILIAGNIVASGGVELAEKIRAGGYTTLLGT